MPKRLTLLAVLGILAASCNNSTSTTPSPAPNSSPVTMVPGASTLTTTAFSPNPVVITHGMSIQFVNSDSVTHNPTANDGSWTSGNIAPSGASLVNFPNAGNFAYHCAIHPNMVAVVNVN